MLQASTLEKRKELQATGDYLAVTFELFFVIGCCVLYSAVSTGFYKLRVMSVGYAQSRATFGILLVTNIVVHSVAIIFVIVQYAVAPGQLEQQWVYLSYYWLALHYIVMGIATYAQARSLVSSVQRHAHRQSTLILALSDMMSKIDGSCLLTAICLGLRAFALIMDSLMVKFVTLGTNTEVIWNVIFKYSLWIGPEMVILLAFGVAMHYTEEAFKTLSVEQMRYKGEGEIYQQMPLDEYHEPNTDNFGNKVDTQDLESVTGKVNVVIGQKPEDVEQAASNNSYILMEKTQDQM